MSMWNDLCLYRDLFVSRSDDYVMQLPTGRYRRVGSSLEMADLSDHLLGVRTYGVYVQDQSGLCRFAVFDADSPNGLEVLERLQRILFARGIVSYLEASRRGAHLWLFFVAPVAASGVRALLRPLCPPGVELYPKQDENRCGYGSAFRLPLGIHRLTGKWYPWLTRTKSDNTLKPVATTREETLIWLLSVVRVHLPDVGEHPHTHIDNPPSPVRLCSSGKYPNIDSWCRAQDPFSLISHYIPLSPDGVGCCPFGEHHRNRVDQHPSFKVYTPSRPGGCSWHCYTWGKGGNVFNFLCYWYRVDARSLWHRIQAGEPF